ncbi:hypothetical protein DPM19_03080 [Actinomadura craniellae]|uniref:Peptidoglycan binding-like domain-containing protein n=2 Tax=Actinomadura craniellae TaxID=2231787 RepID=A0A365HH08_9ACTN|nr:hypothetical protein DPM19_03080 [Actinomadura craniellae]
MWQYILYADNNMLWSEVDCVFGGGTAAATRQWQRAEGLTADGVVGPNTRGRADNYLAANGTAVTYFGATGTLSFTRSSGAGYYYYNGIRITYNRSGGTLPGC